MSKNSITTVTGFAPPADLGKLAAAFKRSQATTAPVSGASGYIKLLKEGVWVYGAEGIEVADNSLWAINPMSIAHGWIAWSREEKGKKRENLGERMWPITTTGGELPPNDDLQLPAGSDEWTEQWTAEFVCVAGEDEGETLTYTAGNRGGLKNFRDGLVNGPMADRIGAGEPCVPIVRLYSSWYPNKTYGGRTYEPEFEVVEWRAIDDASPVAAAEPEVIEPPVEQKPEEPRPSGRRSRRRAAA